MTDLTLKTTTDAGLVLEPPAHDLLEICQLEDLDDRLAAVFLGRMPRERTDHEIGALRGALLWEALPGFLAESGWQLVHKTGVARGRSYAPIEVLAVPLNEERSLQCPKEGHFLFRRALERLVVSFDHYPQSGFEIHFRGDAADEFWKGWQAWTVAHNQLRGETIRPSGRLVEDPAPPTWSDVFLAPEVREQLLVALDRFLGQDQAVLRELGIRSRGGLLLTGRPGTGKTMIARTLAATSAGVTFLWCTPGDLGCGDAVEEILEIARWLAPTVLLLEDLDLVGNNRHMSRNVGTLGTLMNELDGVPHDDPIYVIGTTNCPEDVERALRFRPGRFDRVLEIPPLDAELATRYLEKRLTCAEVAPPVLSALVRRLEEPTGAELEELANTLLAAALRASGPDGVLRIDEVIVERALGEMNHAPQAMEVGFGARRDRRRGGRERQLEIG